MVSSIPPSFPTEGFLDILFNQGVPLDDRIAALKKTVLPLDPLPNITENTTREMIWIQEWGGDLLLKDLWKEVTDNIHTYHKLYPYLFVFQCIYDIAVRPEDRAVFWDQKDLDTLDNLPGDSSKDGKLNIVARVMQDCFPKEAIATFASIKNISEITRKNLKQLAQTTPNIPNTIENLMQRLHVTDGTPRFHSFLQIIVTSYGQSNEAAMLEMVAERVLQELDPKDLSTFIDTALSLGAACFVLILFRKSPNLNPALMTQLAKRLGPSPFLFTLSVPIVPTQHLGYLTEINNIPIQELEKRMRPNEMSTSGFLGPNESLTTCLQLDANMVKQIGWTHEKIAAALKWINQRIPNVKEGSLEYVGEEDKTPQTLSYIVEDCLGSQDDPFNSVPPWNRAYYLTNRTVNVTLFLTPATYLHINRFGFYQGGGGVNLYRNPPEKIVSVLTGIPVEELTRKKE